MYVNDIPEDLINNQVNISQFADDLCMWTSIGPNATFVQYRIHKTYSVLEKWCSKWGIKLNAKKTQLIVPQKSGGQHKKNQASIIRIRNRSCGRGNTAGSDYLKKINSRSNIKMAISRQIDD